MMVRSLDRRALLATAATTALAGFTATLAVAESRERVVKMVARKWVFLPATVEARKGETLVFELSAPEVPMGFSLPDFNVRTDVLPDRVATLKLTPDKAGTFTFLCDIFCGEGHETMNGTLRVTG